MKKLSVLLLLSASASCFAMQTTRLTSLVRQGTRITTGMRGAFVPVRRMTNWQTGGYWATHNHQLPQGQEQSLQKELQTISAKLDAVNANLEAIASAKKAEVAVSLLQKHPHYAWGNYSVSLENEILENEIQQNALDYLKAYSELLNKKQ